VIHSSKGGVFVYRKRNCRVQDGCGGAGGEEFNLLPGWHRAALMLGGFRFARQPRGTLKPGNVLAVFDERIGDNARFHNALNSRDAASPKHLPSL
jgi:hypothetical protein